MFILETDAYGTELGAVLMQAVRPLAYYNKCIGPQAAAQSIYEKEAMAILEALTSEDIICWTISWSSRQTTKASDSWPIKD